MHLLLTASELMTIVEAEKYNNSEEKKNKNAFPEPNNVHWNGNHALVNAMYNHSMVACSVMMLLKDDSGTTAVQKAEMEGLLTKMLMFSFSF
jgi:hypothetical protein